MRPTTKTPTLQPTIAPTQPLSVLYVYFQLDFSGSIGASNWGKILDFVETFLGSMRERLAQVELRVFLSFFTCGPGNNNPRNTVVTSPRFATYDDRNYRKAIDRLRGLSENRMQGTCPSLGARKILGAARVTRGASLYLIVTDGRFQLSDHKPYRRSMDGINRIFRMRLPAQEDRVVCAATIGNPALEQAIARNIRSSCVFPYRTFPELVTSASKMAIAMAPQNIPPQPDDDGGDQMEYEGGNVTDLPSKQPSIAPTKVGTATVTKQPITSKPSSHPTRYDPERSLNSSTVESGDSFDTKNQSDGSNLSLITLAIPIVGVLGVLTAFFIYQRRRVITSTHIDTIQAATQF